MIYMTPEQAAEFGIADLGIAPGTVSIVPEAKIFDIIVAAGA